MKPMTSKDIEAKLEVAAMERVELERQAEGLSLGAVSGDREAVQKLAGVQSRISQIDVDCDVLERAKVGAQRLELSERESAHAARCAVHYGLARGHASDLFELASRMDAVIAEFDGISSQLSEKEKEIWRELRLAERSPSPDVVGRRNISLLADVNVKNAQARGQFATKVSVSDFARMGWSFLLPEGGDDAA